MPYLSASAVVIHYEEALYQVYAPLPYLYCGSCADASGKFQQGSKIFSATHQTRLEPVCSLSELVLTFYRELSLTAPVCMSTAAYGSSDARR